MDCRMYQSAGQEGGNASSMTRLTDRERIVREVCDDTGVDPALVLDLLALEDGHRNLHGYGARPKLRRAAERIIDTASAVGREAE